LFLVLDLVERVVHGFKLFGIAEDQIVLIISDISKFEGLVF